MGTIQLPGDMVFASDVTVMSCGVTTHDGKAVPAAAEELALGPLGAACGATGMSPEETRKGIADLQIVGGTDHETTRQAVASLDGVPVIHGGDHAAVGAPSAVPGRQADRGGQGIG